MLQSLGYAGFRTSQMEDWERLAVRGFGLQLVDKSRSTLTFRMDDRKQRVSVYSDGTSDQPSYFGWEVADAAALAALCKRLDERDVPYAQGSRALAEERHVKDLIVFADPAGNRLEAFYGGEIATDPFVPGRNISGFRTGTLGMGHVVITVERADEPLDFYMNTLGFHMTDFLVTPIRGYFLHLNPRHHSIALLETGKRGIHHLMMELYNLDDVGQGYDIALDGDHEKIAATLGRHSNDWMTSFYLFTPSGFMVEYGWGGRSLDVGNVVPREITEGPNIWGHNRRWMTPEENAKAQHMSREAAANGLRHPVQVIDGNYEVGFGACPWWNEAKAKARTG